MKKVKKKGHRLVKGDTEKSHLKRTVELNALANGHKQKTELFNLKVSALIVITI